VKRIIDILRVILISPEFLILLIVLVLQIYKADWLILIGKQFQSNNEIWKFLPTLPMLFTSLVFKFGKNIRIPLENNKQLYQWDEYYRITDRVHIGIYISILSSIGAISVWLLIDIISNLYIGIIFISSIGISGFSALTMYLASISIREVLDINR